jgi:3-hydroxyisobutyryl-CoA hydrolase
MALTGEKVKGRDLAKCGLATNFVRSDKMESLKSTIIEKSNEDISLEKLQEIVNEYSDIIYTPENFSFPKSDEISRTFVLDDINEVFTRLHRLIENGSEGEQAWANKTLATLNSLSPFSLVVTFEQIKKGTKIQSLEEAFNIEAQMVSA